MKFIITEAQYDSLRRRLDYTESTIAMITGIKSAMKLNNVCDFNDYESYENKILEGAFRHYIFWSLGPNQETKLEKNKDYDLFKLNLISTIKRRFGSKINEYWDSKIKEC